MSIDSKNAGYDPLGLDALRRLIEAAQANPSEMANVASAFEHILRRYTALKDRYRLLKTSARQLAEEVAWLRDQCDDFIMEQESIHDNAAAPAPGDSRSKGQA